MASHDNILEIPHAFEIAKLDESCKAMRIIVIVKLITPLKTKRNV